MRSVRRQLPVLAGLMLMVLLVPTAAVAAQGSPFGTGAQIVEGEGPDQISVTDVSVASLDGFDRITFEITGNGLAGWRVEYDENPATQGQGAPVELPGAATLRVAITNVVIPPDAPEGVEPFLDDVAGPEDGVITEIFNDSIFEGQHVFFVGVEQQSPFRVQRLNDPQRVVVDIASDTPVGGVATGLGGAADPGAPITAFGAGLAILVTFVLAGSRLRSRRTRG